MHIKSNGVTYGKLVRAAELTQVGFRLRTTSSPIATTTLWDSMGGLANPELNTLDLFNLDPVCRFGALRGQVLLVARN